MSAAPLLIPPIQRPFFKGAYGHCRWPQAAQTVWEFICWRCRDGRMTLDDSDRAISQWCRACGYPCGRRTVQKALKQLEQLGEIARHRAHGRRIITLLIPFIGRKPKPLPKGKAPRPQLASSPAATPTPHTAKDPPPTLDEQRQAAASLRAMIGLKPPTIPIHRTDDPDPARTAAEKRRQLDALDARFGRKDDQPPPPPDPGIPPAPSGP